MLFSFLEDEFNNGITLNSKVEEILDKLHCVGFRQLPLDIIQQLVDILKLFPKAETCAVTKIRESLKTMRNHINDMAFFENELDNGNDHGRKKLEELVSWVLTYIIALKQSFSQREIRMKKSLCSLLDVAYETCENIDYLLDLKQHILSCFDLHSVGSKSAIAIKLQQGFELIKELRRFYPNMWNYDICDLIMSTIETELLPSIETANHIIYHYEELSSIPKYHIRLNKLLNLKWTKVNLPPNNINGEHNGDPITLSDYVMNSISQTKSSDPGKTSKRKGLDKLCARYIYSSFEHQPVFEKTFDGWMTSSAESSFSVQACSEKEIKVVDERTSSNHMNIL
jgi:hypothetical protein